MSKKFINIILNSILISLLTACATTEKETQILDKSKIKFVVAPTPTSFTNAGNENLYLCLGDSTVNCFKIPKGENYESLPLKMRNQWINDYQGRLLADDILEAKWPSEIIAKMKLIDNGNSIIYGFDSENPTQGKISWFRGL